MGTIETEKIKIPYIKTVPLTGGENTPFSPSRQDPLGPIKRKIEAQLNNPNAHVLRIGNRAIVTKVSVRPHHKEKSEVHWLPEVDGNTVVEWKNPKSWETLIADTDGLQAFQEKAFNEVDAGNPFYGQFGWTPFNDNPEPWFTKQGGMTINLAHWHSTPPFSRQELDGYITMDKKMTNTDFRFLSLFFDIGSQLAREHISQVKDFSSHKHIWTGMDGLIQRTAYGFYSIQDAIKQLYNFHLSLRDEWKRIAEKLYKQYAGDFTVDFEGVERSLVLFSPIAGGALFIPTKEEKELIGMDSNHPCRVWVSLLSPIMKPLLVNGVQVLRG